MKCVVGMGDVWRFAGSKATLMNDQVDSFGTCVGATAWMNVPVDPRTEKQTMREEFISEAITPVAGAFIASATTGEPALPRQFTWRKRVFEVREVARTWRELDPDRTHGSGHLYLRKHWFEVRVDDDSIMKLYFQRQPSSRRAAKSRWWLYSIARQA